MATATCSLTILNPPQYTIGSQEITYYHTLGFSAATDTYVTGGILLDLTQAKNLAGSSTLPISVFIWPITVQGAGTNCVTPVYIQGTTQANGKVQFFEGSAEKTTATAMNAGANEFAMTFRVAATFTRR